jgi:hypothetical protein
MTEKSVQRYLLRHGAERRARSQQAAGGEEMRAVEGRLRAGRGVRRERVVGGAACLAWALVFVFARGSVCACVCVRACVTVDERCVHGRVAARDVMPKHEQAYV